MEKLILNDLEYEYLKRVMHKNRIDCDSFHSIETSKLAKLNLDYETVIHNETE